MEARVPMGSLIEYIKRKGSSIHIFDILDFLKEENGCLEERSYEEIMEKIVLASEYRNRIYDYQNVFEEMFRGRKLSFHFNWDNFTDLALGNVIDQMLKKWMDESLYFKLEPKECEILRELVTYQFYQDIKSPNGLTKAEIEVYFQKNETQIHNMASFFMGLERTYKTLCKMTKEE